MFLRRHGIDLPQSSIRSTVFTTEPGPAVTPGGLYTSDITIGRRADGSYLVAAGNRGQTGITSQGIRYARKFWPTLMARRHMVKLGIGASFRGPEALAKRWSFDRPTLFEEEDMRVLDPAPNTAIVPGALPLQPSRGQLPHPQARDDVTRGARRVRVRSFGWRVLFYITGGLGLILIVPLYLRNLRPEREAPYREAPLSGAASRLTLASLGGAPFFLILFTYITQGMLFWGITLWIPLTVRSLGFTGIWQAMASALPYLAAVLLAIPMTRLSDRTGRRVLIASLGLLIPGLLMVALPLSESGGMTLAIITLALGLYASSFTPNIWSVIQSSVEPQAVGPAAGIVNGIGAGGGGTIAGFLVGLLQNATGSYIPGFVVLGGLVILGGLSLLLYGRLVRQRLAT